MMIKYWLTFDFIPEIDNVSCKSISIDLVDTRHIFSYMILQIRSFGPNDEILYCMFDLFLSSVHCSKCWIFVKMYKSLQLLLYILMLRRDSCIFLEDTKSIFELTIELFEMKYFESNVNAADKVISKIPKVTKVVCI